MSGHAFVFDIVKTKIQCPGSPPSLIVFYFYIHNRTKFSFCTNPTGDSRERLSIISDPSNNAFTFISAFEMIYILNELRSGNPSFVIIDDKWKTIFIGVQFKKYCPFYQVFNEKMGIFASAGIFDQTYYLKTKKRGLTWKDETIGPQVLTLDDLWVGFVIHVVFLGISTIVFFIEIIPTWVRKFVRKTIMLNVLVGYFRNLYPGGVKLPQKRFVKGRRNPLNGNRNSFQPKFIKVKPKLPSSSTR